MTKTKTTEQPPASPWHLPRTIGEAHRLATIFARSGLAGSDNPDALLFLFAKGAEDGLSPVRAISALVQQSPTPPNTPRQLPDWARLDEEEEGGVGAGEESEEDVGEEGEESDAVASHAVASIEEGVGEEGESEVGGDFNGPPRVDVLADGLHLHFGAEAADVVVSTYDGGSWPCRMWEVVARLFIDGEHIATWQQMSGWRKASDHGLEPDPIFDWASITRRLQAVLVEHVRSHTSTNPKGGVNPPRLVPSDLRPDIAGIVDWAAMRTADDLQRRAARSVALSDCKQALTRIADRLNAHDWQTLAMAAGELLADGLDGDQRGDINAAKKLIWTQIKQADPRAAKTGEVDIDTLAAAWADCEINQLGESRRTS